MLKQAWQRALCSPTRVTRVPQACWQNFVWSETLTQIERQCETCCPFNRFPVQKVTVIGAASNVGRITCLFLKQQPVIKILAMYDEGPDKGLLGIATDLAHIDTPTAVHMYQGKKFLPEALDNTDVVLICGGEYPKPFYCNMPDRVLFWRNMHHVRRSCLAIARFCPHAVTAIQTPPIDCNFTLCKHTLAISGNYDKRRLLGMNTINSMRANQLYAAVANSDPAKSTVPVICGTGRCTRVPVFSANINCEVPPEKFDDLTRLVREADELICKVKCDNEHGDLSIGFASARLITNIMKGLFEKPTFIESALVEQADPKKCFNMEICSTPVTVGKDGVQTCHVPKLNDREKQLLDFSATDLEDMLNMGRCFATGDRYYVHPGKFYQCECAAACPICGVQAEETKDKQQKQKQ